MRNPHVIGIVAVQMILSGCPSTPNTQGSSGRADAGRQMAFGELSKPTTPVTSGRPGADRGWVIEEPIDYTGRKLDADKDDLPARYDNCPTVANPDQKDSDHDGHGDACSLASFKLDRQVAAPGDHLTATITLQVPAPEDGARILLRATPEEVVELRGPVLVPAGRSQAQVDLRVSQQPRAGDVDIIAWWGVTRVERLHIDPFVEPPPRPPGPSRSMNPPPPKRPLPSRSIIVPPAKPSSVRPTTGPRVVYPSIAAEPGDKPIPPRD